MKRPLRVLGIVAASLALVVLGGGFAVYHLVDFDGLVTSKVREQTPALEEALGRRVEVGPIRTHFFPTLAVTVDGLRVAGVDPAEPPLLQVDRVSVDVAFWQALLSFGKRLEVRDVALHGPKIHLERRADGSLSIDDLLVSDGQVDEEREGSAASWPKGLRIRRIHLRDGAVALHDVGADTTATLQRIELLVRNLSEDRPVGVELSLAALAQEPNVSLALEAGPLGALPPAGLPTLRGIRLRADQVDVGALAGFLGPHGAEIEAARLSADVSIPSLTPTAPLEARVELAAAPLHLRGGAPLNATVRLDGSLDLAAGDALLRTLEVDLAGMKVHGKGALHALRSAPRFEDFELRTEGWDLGKLLRHLPPLERALPEGSRLSGPVHLALGGSGDAAAQEVRAQVRLDDAALLVPGALAKPAGVPLGLSADARLADGGAQLRDLRLTAADLVVAIRGRAPSLQPLRYDLDVEAAPFDLDGVVRLAPSVLEALEEAQARAGGSGRLEGHLRGGDGTIDWALAASLDDADLQAPNARVRGDVSLRVHARGAPQGDLTGGLLLDAGQADVRLDGLLHKTPQTPLTVNVQGARAGKTLSFSEFDVRLGDARLEAEGSLSDDGSSLELRLPRLDLAALTRTFPWLPEPLHQGGHLEGRATLSGNPASPASIRAEIPSFEGKIGASDFRLTASLQGLDAPVVQGTLRSDFLDLDALRGAPDGKEPPKDAAPAEDRPFLRSIRADGSVDLKRVRFTGRDLEEVVAQVRVRDGTLRLEEARFRIYGGQVSAAGSEAEIWRGSPPFDVRLEAKDLDVARALAAETDKPSLLAGKGNLDLHLQGTGLEREALERHLQGAWSLSMLEGRVVGPDLRQSILGSFAAIPGMQPSRLSAERAIRDLVGTFEVRDGKMHLEEPLTLNLGGGRLELGGAVGIFGELFLDGAYHVPPADVVRLSGGRCQATEPLAVPVALSGSPSSPSVRSDASVAAALAKTCLASAAEGAVDSLLGEGTGQRAREQVGAAQQEAEQKAKEARESLRQAEEQAREEAARRAQKLREEAERAKREAEEKAKQKAKDAAGGLRKRLGF